VTHTERRNATLARAKKRGDLAAIAILEADRHWTPERDYSIFVARLTGRVAHLPSAA
jgi:hypothetical protein